jgi:hypothetical protein
MVNEISCDANSDIIPREGNKGRRHGIMHTHPHCKQQGMKVVGDEVRMREVEGKNHRAAEHVLNPSVSRKGKGKKKNNMREWYL